MPRFLYTFLLPPLALISLGAAPPATEKPVAEENPYEKRFQELDRDHDGFISLAEWPLDAGSYHQVDRDQDGRLSRAELLTPNTLRRDPLQRFRLLDTNHDGRLSREERQREELPLGGLDANRDGYVSLREYDDSLRATSTFSPRATVESRTRFQLLDRNRDQRLTRTEWSGSPAGFARIDRNRDGVISPSEWPGRR